MHLTVILLVAVNDAKPRQCQRIVDQDKAEIVFEEYCGPAKCFFKEIYIYILRDFKDIFLWLQRLEAYTVAENFEYSEM